MARKKKAQVFKSWNGWEWEIDVRAGAKGTGRIVASVKHWDNGKSEEAAWDILLSRLDRAGYEIVD